MTKEQLNLKNDNLTQDRLFEYLSSVITSQAGLMDVISDLHSNQTVLAKNIGLLNQNVEKLNKNEEERNKETKSEIQKLTTQQELVTEKLNDFSVQSLTPLTNVVVEMTNEYENLEKNISEKIDKLDYTNTLEKVIETNSKMVQAFTLTKDGIDNNIEEVRGMNDALETIGSRLNSIDTRMAYSIRKGVSVNSKNDTESVVLNANKKFINSLTTDENNQLAYLDEANAALKKKLEETKKSRD